MNWLSRGIRLRTLELLWGEKGLRHAVRDLGWFVAWLQRLSFLAVVFRFHVLPPERPAADSWVVAGELVFAAYLIVLGLTANRYPSYGQQRAVFWTQILADTAFYSYFCGFAGLGSSLFLLYAVPIVVAVAYRDWQGQLACLALVSGCYALVYLSLAYWAHGLAGQTILMLVPGLALFAVIPLSLFVLHRRLIDQVWYMHRLTKAAGIGLFVVRKGPSGRPFIEWANEVFQKWFPEARTDASCEEAFGTVRDDNPGGWHTLSAAFQGEALRGITKARTKRGRLVYFDTSAYPLARGSGREVVSVVQVVNDLRHEVRVLAAANQAACGVSIIGRERRDGNEVYVIEFLNRVQREWFPEAKVGDICWEAYNPGCGFTAPCPWCPVTPTIANGRAHVGVTHAPGPGSLADVQDRHFYSSASPFARQGQQVLSVLELAFDVTHIVELERLSDRLTRAETQGDVMTAAAEGLARMVQAHYAAFVLVSPEGAEASLHMAYHHLKAKESDVRDEAVTAPGPDAAKAFTELEDPIVVVPTGAEDPRSAWLKGVGGRLSVDECAAIPVAGREGLRAVIVLWGFQKRPVLTPEERLSCRTAADQVSSALEKAAICERRGQELAILRQVDESLAQGLTERAIQELIVAKMMQLVHPECAQIRLTEPDGKDLILQLELGVHGGTIPRSRRIGEGISGLAVERRCPFLDNDVQINPDHAKALAATADTTERGYMTWKRSEVAAPLIQRGKVLGVLIAVDSRKGRFSSADALALIDLAGRAASAIDNARLLEARTKFLRYASHTLLGPVTIIRGFGELLLDKQAKSEAQAAEWIRIVLTQAHNQERIIGELLAQSEIETGVIHPKEPKHISLLESVRSWRGDFLAALEADIGIEATSRVGDVSTNPERLRAVFTNLIDNAIKYCQGTPRIRVGLDCTENEAIITVSDNGVGFTLADRQGLFKQFFRGSAKDRLGNPDMEGTGLGLFICGEYARALGGHVAMLKSEPGEGSTFEVRVARHLDRR